MAETPVPPRRKKPLIVLILFLFIAAIIGILLALRSCHPAVPPPVAAPLPFDYFRAKAEELHKDPAQIMTFVRDTMPTLDYRGNVKGALGALWNGAASVDEKKLLAEALLTAAAAPRSVTLDEISTTRDKIKDNALLKLTIIRSAWKPLPPAAAKIPAGLRWPRRRPGG